MTPARIVPVADTEAAPAAAELLAACRDPDGMIPDVFRTLAHHPRLMRHFNALGAVLLHRGLIPDRARELVILRTAWRGGCRYEFSHHSALGRRAGLSDEEIRRTAKDGVADWDDDDASLLHMTDELCVHHHLDTTTWERLAARWSTPQLVELLVLPGFYLMLGGLVNGAAVHVDGPLDEEEVEAWWNGKR